MTGQWGPALAVLGALLERSLVQIGDAAADARSFDRQSIRAVTDVWDNNTFPLFRAATADTAEEREQRAPAALEWMAGLGARRAWTVEQVTPAGHTLDGLLPPARADAPGRDYRGFVMAPALPVTPDVAVGLAADNDASREPAVLDIQLEDIDKVVFDSHDAQGTALQPAADGISIDIGAHSTLHAATAVLRPDDRCWHLSAAGRQADARTPPRSNEARPVPYPQKGRLDATAEAAATMLKHAMLKIRMVRYADYADRIPVRDFCRAFAGAGQAILTAGAEPESDGREAAFRDLIETWARRGGPRLARWFTWLLRDVTGSPDLLERVRAQAQTRLPDGAPAPAHGSAPSPGPLPEAELRMADYTAANTSGAPAAPTCPPTTTRPTPSLCTTEPSR